MNNFSFKVADVALFLSRTLADLFHYNLMFFVSFLKSTVLNSTCHPMICFVKLLFHYCLMFSCLILTLFTLFLMNISLNKCDKLVQLFFFTTLLNIETIFTLLEMSLLIIIPLIHMIFLTPMIVAVMTICFT